MTKPTKTTTKTKTKAVKTTTKTTTKPKKEKVPKIPKPKKPRNYLNNRDLLAEVIKSKEQDMMTDKLAHMLHTLCARYGKKGQYAGYTYNDDMQAYAMMMIVKTWHKFKPEKSNNPFAFYTQCIKHSFIQFLNQERRQRDIRDILLVDQGMNPSFTFQMDKSKGSVEKTPSASVTETDFPSYD